MWQGYILENMAKIASWVGNKFASWIFFQIIKCLLVAKKKISSPVFVIRFTVISRSGEGEKSLSLVI